MWRFYLKLAVGRVYVRISMFGLRSCSVCCCFFSLCLNSNNIYHTFSLTLLVFQSIYFRFLRTHVMSTVTFWRTWYSWFVSSLHWFSSNLPTKTDLCLFVFFYRICSVKPQNQKWFHVKNWLPFQCRFALMIYIM